MTTSLRTQQWKQHQLLLKPLPVTPAPKAKTEEPAPPVKAQPDSAPMDEDVGGCFGGLASTIGVSCRFVLIVFSG